MSQVTVSRPSRLLKFYPNRAGLITRSAWYIRSYSMTFWNRVYCLLGLWTYILYQIHAAAFCKYAILDIIGTKSLPYPRLITTCMNQNLLCSSQVIKFPEVIPYNIQTKCFKTLTFEQHSLPRTCIFISFSMSPSAGQLCTKIHTSRSALKTL